MIAQRLGVGVLEEKDVVHFLARGFVEADGIHFFAIGGGIGNPDLIVHDDRCGPGAAGDGGFPDDVLVLAPFGGKAVVFSIRGSRIVAVVRWPSESWPFGLAGKNQAKEDDGSNEHGDDSGG